MLYFPYSTWQGNDLSVIKNFLAISMNILIVPTTLIHHAKSGRTHCVVTFTTLFIAVPAEENCLAGSLPYAYLVLYYYNIALFTPRCAIWKI